MRTNTWLGNRHCRKARQPALALLCCAQFRQEEAGHDLAAGIARSEQAGALDNLCLLACNRGI
jgi:hypothetical protein